MIDARRRKASADAMPAKNMPGRKAGEDHARSQGPLRGEAFVGSTGSLATISGFTVFKRTAALTFEIPCRCITG
ncbi:hypothetical protein DS67_06055 [Mesotoga sp. SC_4PWA21]|nr:hypothetical protein DS67_06055 [Mesotoga sp. SC_4PWA21]